jgi:hypothetical protein
VLQGQANKEITEVTLFLARLFLLAGAVVLVKVLRGF